MAPDRGPPAEGWQGGGLPPPDAATRRALARLWRRFHLRDRQRIVTLHEGVALQVGALGVLRCELALTPAGATPSLLTVGLAVLTDDERVALCAAAELPECWRIEVGAGWTVRYRHPDGGRFRTRELILPGERIAPERWPGLAVEPLGRFDGR